MMNELAYRFIFDESEFGDNLESVLCTECIVQDPEPSVVIWSAMPRRSLGSSDERFWAQPPDFPEAREQGLNIELDEIYYEV
ncbi:hypothetical protein N7537_001712 [Penicillium hordei]|uniref:Uncharacterized protein n=1 Tax=Penicillium hordei TaxID=40994 RepID=A0AAD6EGC9_9EURO|nr:uncharacterized protein N7537_001712 [Penicillium hordei]KAJ5616598.1 hypothetical protein N7537_001712 [Penicillium hordei]